MKSKFLLLTISIFAFLFGCSNPAEPVDANLKYELNTKSSERPFKVKGQGTFVLATNNTQCDLPFQINLEGNGNSTHLGLFQTSIYWCTDFAGQEYLSGTITAANGDELYFESVFFGEDENGGFGDYVFEGGTGRFVDSYGELRLYTTTIFETNTSGTYSNYGEGFLQY